MSFSLFTCTPLFFSAPRMSTCEQEVRESGTVRMIKKEYDTITHIDSHIPVEKVSCVAVVCSTEEFLSAVEHWESLVRTDNWEDVNTVLDTVLFADGLENAMGRVQLEKTGSCVWNRSSLETNIDLKKHMIAKAIPCENGQQYVVGVFKWK